MPRTVAPVQPYMADNSAILKASQAGWEMGMKMPTTAGSIMAGVQQGMQMANTVASFQDKYGADAQAAKERKAQMEGLQIQQAQQQLAQGDLRTQQLQAEQPYFGQEASNKAKTSDIELQLAELQKTRTEATVANLPLEINNKNVETQLGITGKTLSLSEQQRALTADLQKQNDRLALSNQFASATTPDDFVAARKSLNDYWGKNGMQDYDKLSAQFALEAKVKGVANDPRVSGYINSGSPLTAAGVEAKTRAYQKIETEATKSLSSWADAFHQGGKFQLDTNGQPVREQMPDPNNPGRMIDGPKIGEDWSKVKQVVTENFQTPKTDINGAVQYGGDGLPVMEAPKVADVMANLNFVGADGKGKLVFRNSAKASNNTFAVDPAEGNRLLDLIHHRDNLKTAQDGINVGVQTLRYMDGQGKSAISPDEMIQLNKQFAKPTITMNGGNGTAAAGGGNGVLPNAQNIPQELAGYVKDWRDVYQSGGKPNPVTKSRLDLLQVNDPQAYAEVVRLGNAGVPVSSQPKTPGAKTPASYYQPLP